MLRELYLRLCLSTIFREVLDKPLLKFFGDFCKEGAREEDRLRAYTGLCLEIYRSGKSLAGCVLDLLYENENVYVKRVARDEAIPSEIRESLDFELSVFGEFAALAPECFRRELDIPYLPPFATENTNVKDAYLEHTGNIGSRGFGIFASCPMFRLSDQLAIEPVISADKISLSHFVGYTAERERVIANTEALLSGRPALNTLLYGDAGTGKSSTVKAIVNHYFDKGLRLIELRRDQLCYLPLVMAKISETPLKFIIFIDDLSFGKSDDSFSMLKAALEGSASATSKNAVIYATSNRRHIIKESFSDRDGDDVHRNDTLQETLSLSERFGLTVAFSKPTKTTYLDIVRELARRAGIAPNEELEVRAEAYALRRGTRSARAAEQFVELLLSEKK